MKKIVSLLLAFVLALSLAACAATQTKPYESVNIRLGGLKGPTSMGMAKLLDDAENGRTANTYTFTMAPSAGELTPQLIKGELDILAVPVNVASILYNQTQGAVQLLAASTLGVLYITEKGGETVTDVRSLAGKTLYATGKGATPEYALTYLLAQNGLTLGEDVTVEWKSEPSEIVALMAQEEHAIAMLPQPFVTVAQGKLLVRKAFADEHPEAVAKFLEEYAASTDYANSNPAETAALVEKLGIVNAAVAEKALPKCNLVCITGAEMKTAVSGYLQTLYDLKPEAVGGAMPDDGFYRLGA